MNYFNPDDLDQDERELYDAIESSETQSVPNVEDVKTEAVAIAKATLYKTRNINIRLSERDVYKLKAKAVEEGIPYQTLASSILHKAASR